MSPRQIRAARAILSLSQQELADRAGISVNSVIRIESGTGTTTAVYFSVVRALAEAGVNFIPADDRQGEGIRLTRHNTPAPSARPPPVA